MWRVFVGLRDEHGDAEDVLIDVSVPDWDDAREILLFELEPFEDDECDACQRAGAEAVADLFALEAGVGWIGEIDGNEYSMRVAG